MYQLDVDSVSFPSFNINQVLNVRTRTGRVESTSDFFQDNDIRTTELSLSGTWHNDGGHATLAHSVCGGTINPASVANATISTSATSKSGKYGEDEGDKTFTLVIAPPDTDGANVIMVGCLVTNLSISADMGTDGGQYKFSATISSGRVPQLTNTQTAAGNAYSATMVDMSGIDISEVKIAGIAPILSSFGLTIDSPAVYLSLIHI